MTTNSDSKTYNNIPEGYLLDLMTGRLIKVAGTTSIAPTLGTKVSVIS